MKERFIDVKLLSANTEKLRVVNAISGSAL